MLRKISELENVKTKLKKRFSIGYSTFLNWKEHVEIISRYGEYIHEIYFSPPFGKKFHTRVQTAYQFQSDEVKEIFWQVLKYSKENGIKLNLALNNHGMSKDDIKMAIEKTQSKIDIDEITTTLIHARTSSHLLGKKINISFNQGIDNTSELQGISPEIVATIIPGRSSIRNFKLFNNIISSGFKTKLLLNNGCSFFCHKCISGGCFKYNPDFILADWIKSLNMNQLYALQTIMPFELHEYGYIDNRDINYFKLSTRPSSFKYLNALLKSYIDNVNSEIVREYSPERGSIYHLWGRGNILPPGFSELKFDDIANFKRNVIWKDEIYRSFETSHE